MGYFPNGTSGADYEGAYCVHCIHYEAEPGGLGCPVMNLHTLYNYDQFKATPEGKMIEAVLNALIPRAESDLHNDRCAMFVNRLAVTDEHLKDWEKYKAAMAEMSTARPRSPIV